MWFGQEICLLADFLPFSSGWRIFAPYLVVWLAVAVYGRQSVSHTGHREREGRKNLLLQPWVGGGGGRGGGGNKATRQESLGIKDAPPLLRACVDTALLCFGSFGTNRGTNQERNKNIAAYTFPLQHFSSFTTRRWRCNNKHFINFSPEKTQLASVFFGLFRLCRNSHCCWPLACSCMLAVHTSLYRTGVVLLQSSQ